MTHRFFLEKKQKLSSPEHALQSPNDEEGLEEMYEDRDGFYEEESSDKKQVDEPTTETLFPHVILPSSVSSCLTPPLCFLIYYSYFSMYCTLDCGITFKNFKSARIMGKRKGTVVRTDN